MRSVASPEFYASLEDSEVIRKISAGACAALIVTAIGLLVYWITWDKLTPDPFIVPLSIWVLVLPVWVGCLVVAALGASLVRSTSQRWGFVALGLLTPALAFSGSALYEPLAKEQRKRQRQEYQQESRERMMRQFDELTAYFSVPRRVLAARSNYLILEDGFSVRLYSPMGKPLALERKGLSNVVNRDVKLMLPPLEFFMQNYTGAAKSGVTSSYPWARNSRGELYGDIPAYLAEEATEE